LFENIFLVDLSLVMTQIDEHMNDEENDDMINLADSDGDGQISMNEFLKIFDKKQDMQNIEVKEADPKILANLEKRMLIYSDILQNIRSREEITELLIRFKNQVPPLINYLEETFKDNRTFVPPAYLLPDGSRFAPKRFEVELSTVAK